MVQGPVLLQIGSDCLEPASGSPHGGAHGTRPEEDILQADDARSWTGTSTLVDVHVAKESRGIPDGKRRIAEFDVVMIEGVDQFPFGQDPSREQIEDGLCAVDSLYELLRAMSAT